MTTTAVSAATQPATITATYTTSKATPGRNKAEGSAPTAPPRVNFSQTLSQALRPTESIYTSMTPAQMKGVAQDLYNSGKIDLTQLFMLQNAGVLGKQGPNGELIPLSADEKARLDNTPFNYIQLAKSAMQYLEQTGAASDSKSGYAEWQGILNTLQPPVARQTSPV